MANHHPCANLLSGAAEQLEDVGSGRNREAQRGVVKHQDDREAGHLGVREVAEVEEEEEEAAAAAAAAVLVVLQACWVVPNQA